MAARRPECQCIKPQAGVRAHTGGGGHRGAYKASKPIPLAQFLQGYTPKVIIISVKCRLVFLTKSNVNGS